MPAAQAAAAPALLPPGVRDRSHGLRVIPVSGLSPNAFQPNSGVVVLPRMIAPASRSLAVAGASSGQSWSGSTSRDPRRVGKPRVRIRSLIVTGTPSSGPTASPRCHRLSDALAAASAPSRSTTTERVDARLQCVEPIEE